MDKNEKHCYIINQDSYYENYFGIKEYKSNGTYNRNVNSIKSGDLIIYYINALGVKGVFEVVEVNSKRPVEWDSNQISYKIKPIKIYKEYVLLPLNTIHKSCSTQGSSEEITYFEYETMCREMDNEEREY